MGENGQDSTNISKRQVDAAIWEAARPQFGHVTRAQLLRIGLSDGGIKGRQRSGFFVTRYPGVYAIAPPRDDPPALAAAAVLACGPHAALSHSSAAYLWGFQRHWQPPPEVTLTQGDRRPRIIRIHRCPSLTRRDIRDQLDIPTTSPERTILDLAPRLPTKQLTRMVNDARLSGHLHLATLQDLLARNHHHPGTKLLQPFADDKSNPTRSDFEDDFLAFTQKYGLPTPLTNVMVNGREADAYFPDHNLIVECDGWDTHSSKRAFEDDRERDAEHLRHGIRTIRITRDRFDADPDREAERLQEILDHPY